MLASVLHAASADFVGALDPVVRVIVRVLARGASSISDFSLSRRRRTGDARRQLVLAPLTPSKRNVEPHPYATHASCASTCSAAARRMFQRMSLLTAATYARADDTTTSVSLPEPENFRDVV